MIRIIFSTMCFMACSCLASAQFFVGAQGSYLASSEYKNIGLGLQGKLMATDNLAIGIQYRNFPYKSTDDYETNGFVVESRNRLSSFSAMAEYYLGKDVYDPYVGPFIGIDVGYFNNKVITYATGENVDLEIDHERPFLGIGPKAGIMVRPGSAISFFGQVQYTFAVGNREPDDINIAPQNLDNFSIENIPINNAWTFDLGVLVSIGE